jgi:hypothetical protein
VASVFALLVVSLCTAPPSEAQLRPFLES